MKISLFKKHAKNGSAPKHRLMYQVARDPYTDWAIIFSIGFALAVILIVAGMFTYFSIQSDTSNTSGGATTAAIDTKPLEQVISQWAAQDKTRADLEKGYAGPGDPSQ